MSPRRQRRLVEALGTPDAVLAAPEQAIASIAGPKAARALSEGAPASAIEASLRWAEQPGNEVVTWTDPRYPALLREIADPPLALFVRGNPDVLSGPALAIVGSRNATPQGVQDAGAFASALASNGYVIASGMASGIDAAAHRGALRAAGRTIAVWGTGPDIAYPASNRALAEQIELGGAIVSEFAPGTPPAPGNFPKRNRIISGLSRGVLVVEAAERSGSLITARFALDQNREVFAIPGSIHSPHSKGCHRLIREGAALVESSNDILAELGHVPLPEQPRTPAPAMPAGSSPVLRTLGCGSLTAEELCDCSGMQPDEVMAELSRLQLEGLVVRMPGGRFQRNPEPAARPL